MPDQLETVPDVEEPEADEAIMKELTAMFARTEITAGESKQPSMLTRIAVRMLAVEKKQREEAHFRTSSGHMHPCPSLVYVPSFIFKLICLWRAFMCADNG